MAKVAVVTGSNKGIGKAIVRGLCKQFDGHVYLTARDESRGQQAIQDLKEEGLSPRFHQLDINDPMSIDRLRLHLEQNYGGLDVLVNNAGIAFPIKSTVALPQQADITTKTNFWGTLGVCNKLFPLLRNNSRVVHIASSGGPMTLAKSSQQAKERIRRINTISEIEQLVTEFVVAVKNDTVEALGLPKSCYGVTKLALNLVTPIQQDILEKDETRKDVIVNSCCPGLVSTDMSGQIGVSPDEGADTPLYLALLPPGNAANPRGKFVSNRKVQNVESSAEEIEHYQEMMKMIAAKSKRTDLES